jgi:hypothetical protein
MTERLAFLDQESFQAQAKVHAGLARNYPLSICLFIRISSGFPY